MNNNKGQKDKWDIVKILASLLFTVIGGFAGAFGGTFTALTNLYFSQQELYIKLVKARSS